MLSISTAFHIAKKKSWDAAVSEAKELGFEAVELNVELPSQWRQDVVRSVSSGKIKVSSVHNYCPRIANLPKGRTVYSGYLMTSDDAEERALSKEFTFSSIDFAAETGAKALVLHAGEVPMDPSGREFLNYVIQAGRQGRLFYNYFDTIMKERANRIDKYIDFLSLYLEDCLAYAQKKKISLGLENRFYIHEIPNIEDLHILFERFAGAPLFYWHDTGHAEVFVRLGVCKKHEDFLEPFKDNILGFHIHDIKGLNDHLAPGTGDFDFNLLKPYIKDGHLKVVEAHSKSTKEDVVSSIKYLKSCGIE